MNSDSFLSAILVFGAVILFTGILAIIILFLSKVAKVITIAPLKAGIRIVLGFIADVRVVGLLATTLAVLSFYNHKGWHILSMFVSFQFFCLAALNQLFFLRASWKPKIIEVLPEEIKGIAILNKGIIGFLSLLLAFALVIFQVPTFFNSQPFEGIGENAFRFKDAFYYAMQVILDLDVFLDTSRRFGFSISDIKIKEGNYAIDGFVLAYQLLLILILVRIGRRIWQNYSEKRRSKHR